MWFVPFLVLQTQPTYLVPVSEWEKLFAAPNGTEQEAAAAWAPIADVLAKEVAKLPPQASRDTLYKMAGQLGPPTNARMPYLGVMTDPVPIRNGGHSALFGITASIRDRTTNGMISRNALILITEEMGKTLSHVVTACIPLMGGRISDGTGYRQGKWLAIGASDWIDPFPGGYGPPTAALLELKNGKWATISSHRGALAGIAVAEAGLKTPQFRVKLITGGDKVIALTDGDYPFEFVEEWKLQGMMLTPGPRREIHNEYWVAESFVKAMRGHDLVAARKMVVSGAVLEQAESAKLDHDYGAWLTYPMTYIKPSPWQKVPENKDALQLNATKPEGLTYWVLLHFWTVNNHLLIAGVEKSTDPQYQNSKPTKPPPLAFSPEAVVLSPH